MNGFTTVDKPGRYRTRDGREALVFYDDGTTIQPIVGAYKTPYVNATDTWEKNGHYFSGTNIDYNLDIVEYLGPLQPGDDGFGGRE